jgi:hypothetical protein
MLLTAVPAREANMDGELHVTGACCIDSIMGDDCPKCGGILHQQPVYHGIADLCEVCDIDVWEPFGTYGTDKGGFVDHRETLEAIRWRDEGGVVHLAWVGKMRVALGCGLSPYPRPEPVEDAWPTCLDCVVNEASKTRFRAP